MEIIYYNIFFINLFKCLKTFQEVFTGFNLEYNKILKLNILGY